jgi:hypothetical protein
VAALKESKERIEALEAEVAALKPTAAPQKKANPGRK